MDYKNGIKIEKKLTYYSVDLPEGVLFNIIFEKMWSQPKIIDNISEIKKNRLILFHMKIA